MWRKPSASIRPAQFRGGAEARHQHEQRRHYSARMLSCISAWSFPVLAGGSFERPVCRSIYQ
jgi:hypothetical protein